MDGTRRAFLMAERFKKELGYKFPMPFPIYDHGSKGTVVYPMIHASDHPEAPKFMVRAYRTTTRAAVPSQLLKLSFADFDDVDGDIAVDLDGQPSISTTRRCN